MKTLPVSVAFNPLLSTKLPAKDTSKPCVPLTTDGFGLVVLRYSVPIKWGVPSVRLELVTPSVAFVAAAF